MVTIREWLKKTREQTRQKVKDTFEETKDKTKDTYNKVLDTEIDDAQWEFTAGDDDLKIHVATAVFAGMIFIEILPL